MSLKYENYVLVPSIKHIEPQGLRVTKIKGLSMTNNIENRGLSLSRGRGPGRGIHIWAPKVAKMLKNDLFGFWTNRMSLGDKILI